MTVTKTAKPAVVKKAHRDALDEFRRKNLKELEKTIKVFISIRDNEDEQARNRIEAGKAVARMLAALQPDRQVQEKVKKEEKEVFTKEQSKEIMDRVDSIIYGSDTTKIPG